MANIHEEEHDNRRKLAGEEIEIEVFSNDIPIFANRMIVAGFTKDTACTLEEEEDDHSGAAGGLSNVMALLSATVAAAALSLVA